MNQRTTKKKQSSSRTIPLCYEGQGPCESDEGVQKKEGGLPKNNVRTKMERARRAALAPSSRDRLDRWSPEVPKRQILGRSVSSTYDVDDGDAEATRSKNNKRSMSVTGFEDWIRRATHQYGKDTKKGNSALASSGGHSDAEMTWWLVPNLAALMSTRQ